MTIYSSENITTTYDSKLHMLQLKLKSNVNSEHLRNSYEQALTFAKKNNIKRWLVDLSQISNLKDSDEQWINTTFFPNIMISMGRQNYFGMVLAPECYQKLKKSTGAKGLKSYNSYIIINTFDSPENALTWLSSSSSVF